MEDHARLTSALEDTYVCVLKDTMDKPAGEQVGACFVCFCFHIHDDSQLS